MSQNAPVQKLTVERACEFAYAWLAAHGIDPTKDLIKDLAEMFLCAFEEGEDFAKQEAQPP